MRIMKQCLAIMVVIMLVTACVPNHVPYYVAGKVETMAAARKQQEMADYLQAFKQKRAEFETQLDAFYINSLREAEEQGVLTAKGVAYLNQREAEMRAEFDANEAVQLRKLENNLKFYDDIIEFQDMIISSVRETERQNALAFNELVVELGEYAIVEAETAATRRKEWLEKQASGQPLPEIVAPKGGTVEIIEHQPPVAGPSL